MIVGKLNFIYTILYIYWEKGLILYYMVKINIGNLVWTDRNILCIDDNKHTSWHFELYNHKFNNWIDKVILIFCTECSKANTSYFQEEEDRLTFLSVWCSYRDIRVILTKLHIVVLIWRLLLFRMEKLTSSFINSCVMCKVTSQIQKEKGVDEKYLIYLWWRWRRVL